MSVDPVITDFDQGVRRYTTDVCGHLHRTYEAAEQCEAAEWRRRERDGMYSPEVDDEAGEVSA